ncbi:MAG: phosphoribosylformylglycinamidine synthase subunit PurQ [Planctomycetota bacterium]
MTTTPTALIVRTAGTNCDTEMCRAFELAGAQPELVHVRALIADPSPIARASLVGIPGGFSHGDDIAAGRVLAVTMRERLWAPLSHAVHRGVPVIGVCNGFQVLVQLGLLPGPAPSEPFPAEPPRPTLALVSNLSGRFVDRWCRVSTDPASDCVWTAPLKGLATDDPAACLPVAHAEGRLIAETGTQLERLADAGQIPLRYAPTDNPNGSALDAAGVCDTTGLVFGLMPHPERYLTPAHHPRGHAPDPTPGLAMFRAAVEHAIGASV